MSSLLVLLPAGQEAGVGDPTVALRANAAAYQVAMASLGAGSIFLGALLLRTRLVPRFLAAWGLIGYGRRSPGAGDARTDPTPGLDFHPYSKV